MLSVLVTRGATVNVVTLIGNLATEVEVKDLDDERKVASFVLAVDRRGREGGADFFRIAAWNRQAELCGQFLTKGRCVGIDGRLRSRSWEDTDGKRRTAVEVVAHHVEFLSPPATAPGTPFEEAAAA
jgi:single-strand DNA-binding protein